MQSTSPEDEISRNHPVGSRVVKVLDVIWREAIAHGLRPSAPAPTLFIDSAQQQTFEKLRMRALRALSRLRRVALEEDQKNTGEYPETERLLGELNEFNELYLALVLPRMEELLVPVGKRRAVDSTKTGCQEETAIVNLLRGSDGDLPESKPPSMEMTG